MVGKWNQRFCAKEARAYFIRNLRGRKTVKPCLKQKCLKGKAGNGMRIQERERETDSERDI